MLDNDKLFRERWGMIEAYENVVAVVYCLSVNIDFTDNSEKFGSRLMRRNSAYRYCLAVRTTERRLLHLIKCLGICF